MAVAGSIYGNINKIENSISPGSLMRIPSLLAADIDESTDNPLSEIYKNMVIVQSTGVSPESLKSTGISTSGSSVITDTELDEKDLVTVIQRNSGPNTKTETEEDDISYDDRDNIRTGGLENVEIPLNIPDAEEFGYGKVVDDETQHPMIRLYDSIVTGMNEKRAENLDRGNRQRP